MQPSGLGLLDDRLTGRTEQSRKTKLGIILRESRDRVFNGYKIVKLEDRAQGGKTLWKLEDLKKGR